MRGLPACRRLPLETDKGCLAVRGEGRESRKSEWFLAEESVGRVVHNGYTAARS